MSSSTRSKNVEAKLAAAKAKKKKFDPDAAAALLKDRDHRILRTTVPCYMMLLASMELKKRGELLRKDYQDYLDQGSIAPLQGLDILSISRLAKQTDEISVKILRDVSPDSPHDMLLATCYMILRMVEEGLITDATSTGVLTAAALIEEAKEEPESWHYSDKKVVRLSNDMLTRARLYQLI